MRVCATGKGCTVAVRSRKYKIIANPTAGGGAGERAIPQIERWLTKYGLDFDIVCIERPWHAVQLAEEAAIAECDVIVAAGGDGTGSFGGISLSSVEGGCSYAIRR
jgi:hypothetical protein